jgi:hypothetical protein
MIAMVKRETRANVIFLTVFLALCIPGATILFIKQLRPGAPRLAQPDAVLRQLPYMASLPVPPGTRWIVPGRTRDWLEEQRHARMGTHAMLSANPPGPDWEPVISSDHKLQVVALINGPSTTSVDMILWDSKLRGNVELYSISIRGTSPPFPPVLGRIEGVEQLTVPQEVRRELVDLGYTHPPTRVTRVRAEFQWKAVLDSKVRLSLDHADDTDPLLTTVDFVVR